MHDSVEKGPEENVGEQAIEESIDEHMIETGEELSMLVTNEHIDEKGKQEHGKSIEEKSFVGGQTKNTGHAARQSTDRRSTLFEAILIEANG